MRVLIAEDEDLIRVSLATHLRGEGLDVDLARDGAEAAQLLDAAAGEYDVVVTDLRMPGLSGVKVIDRARSLKPEVKVLVITAMDDMGIEEVLGERRVEFHLQKPFDLERIARHIQSLCARPGDSETEIRR